ncbi:hypothetical protein BX600DRAFT_458064 [Xylariales sp. PMI_506]|nr:hypothetical protein BX600DRAFT_458064 [Xylariales sp. PMI_506]
MRRQSSRRGLKYRVQKRRNLPPRECYHSAHGAVLQSGSSCDEHDIKVYAPPQLRYHDGPFDSFAELPLVQGSACTCVDPGTFFLFIPGHQDHGMVSFVQSHSKKQEGSIDRGRGDGSMFSYSDIVEPQSPP